MPSRPNWNVTISPHDAPRAQNVSAFAPERSQPPGWSPQSLAASCQTMPPQRLLREAIFYTTTAQTPDVQNGTLDMLLSPECWNQA